MSQIQASTNEVDAATARGWVDRGEAVLIDVREADEHAREHIAGSKLVALSGFDPAKIPAANGSRIVVHCKSGRRGAEACGRLAAAGYRDVLNLKGGIEGWKAAGYPVVADARMPISIMRQVQVVVGAVVLVGSVLAAMVSPWFLVLTGFFGAGLLFAGATGTCGLAAVLGWMPWNRVFRTSVTCGRDGMSR
ncbi:MAG: rhodanese-like domain-containing protein [Phycisphaerae bacterium]|nr:rhodanese-like domain-containing protein [Phycisphaerae bacterium]